jgi:DNA repair exonuclease SbcCD ATPase subunit
MSEVNENDTVDAESVFDVDFTSNPVSSGIPAEKPKKEKPKEATQDNPFEGVEETLGLPKGSTKEGLATAKREVKKITDEAKNLKTQAKIVATKQKMAASDDGLVPGFSLESLEEDRKALRNHYMELFARGKKVLDRIEEDLEDLVNPEPDDYANYQRQYAIILKTLDSIRETLVTLRKEEEIHSQKTTAAVGPGGTAAEPGAGGTKVNEDGSIEVTAQDTNAWIAKWTEELDKETAADIQREFDERNAPKAITDETGEN